MAKLYLTIETHISYKFMCKCDEYLEDESAHFLLNQKEIGKYNIDNSTILLIYRATIGCTKCGGHDD